MVFLLFFITVKTFREIAREVLSYSLHLHNNVLVYFVLFLLYTPLNRLLSKKWPRRITLGITLASAGYISLFSLGDLNFYSLIGMSGMAIILVLFRWGYEYYLNFFEERSIPLHLLKPGAILSNQMIDKIKSMDPEYLEELGPVMPDGLTEKQVKSLKQWFEKWNIEPKVGLRKTLPFAPPLLFGTAITIWFKGFPFSLHG